MYAFIKGKIVQSTPGYVTLDTNGVGYKISIPASTFSKIPQLNEELLLHTSFVVREQSQALYGFLSVQERDLFETLLGISGIGPRTALNLIGHLSLHEMHDAISRGNIALICKVPGIGKKTAERLMVEVKDRLHALLPLHPSEYAVSLPIDKHTQTINDAMSALINLGYNQMTAQKAIKKTLKDATDPIDLGSLITLALKNV